MRFQRAKKVVSDSLGLVDIALGLVNSVLNLPDGHFSVTAQRSVRKLANRLCKPIDLRLVFTTFKVRNLFNVKDAVPEGLRTRVVYKFSCTSCNACYVQGRRSKVKSGRADN